MVPETGFTQEVYERIREGAISSAEVVVPLVMEHVTPATLLDVGCGEGWWLKEFQAHGVEEVLGLDAEPSHDFPSLGVDLSERLSLRLRQPVSRKHWDLVLALEVAEHLPAKRATTLVKDLCTLGSSVLFSAAIPGQGGTGHLNEQWPSYWVERFRACGFSVSGALRWSIWNNDKVENWYCQNLMFATSQPERFPALFDTPLAEPFPVVHPVLFQAHRA